MTRKIHNGEFKNAERTKLKLLQGVGEIIKEKGYTGLLGVKIAEKAKLASRNIYRYFGSVENLIE